MSWYRDSFGADYLEVYAHRSDHQGREETAAIVRLLELREGDLVLDVACGAGRHSFALRAAGFRVTGVDLSPELLAHGRRRIDGPNDLFVRGDMRALPLRPGFRAAVSLFTSFGYFDRENEDRQVLEEIHRVLDPDGRFLLDFLNRARVVRDLVPRSEERQGDRRIVQERRLSADGRRIEKTIRVTTGRDAGEKVFRESVRLYGRADIETLFESAGFRVTGALGSFCGEEFCDASPRLIVTARAVPTPRSS